MNRTLDISDKNVHDAAIDGHVGNGLLPSAATVFSASGPDVTAQGDFDPPDADEVPVSYASIRGD